MSYPTKKLGEITKIVGGGTPSTKNESYWGSGHFWATPRDLAQLKITDINSTARTITDIGLEHSSAELLPVGSVILSSRAPIGYVAVTTEPMAINQGCRAFICGEEINNRYLYYFLVISKKYLQSLGRGATFTEISKSTLEKVKIPLPPLAIQRQIVERLDKVVAAQKLNDDLIQKSDELFQSLLHKELNPVGKNWGVRKLEELITDTKNGFASRPVTDGVGQMRPNNIDSDGTLNLSNIKFVPKSYRNIKNYSLKSGDILFNNTNSVELVGKTTFIDADYDYVFSNHMTRIRANQEIVVPKFLAIFLQHLYSLGKFRFLCTPWVNQAAVNSTALERLKIPLPSLETQKQIVAKLSAAQNYKTQLLAQKSKFKELFNSVLAKSFK